MSGMRKEKRREVFPNEVAYIGSNRWEGSRDADALFVVHCSPLIEPRIRHCAWRMHAVQSETYMAFENA